MLKVEVAEVAAVVALLGMLERPVAAAAAATAVLAVMVVLARFASRTRLVAAHLTLSGRILSTGWTRPRGRLSAGTWW